MNWMLRYIFIPKEIREPNGSLGWFCTCEFVMNLMMFSHVYSELEQGYGGWME